MSHYRRVMQTAELARLISELPLGVAQMVAFTLADSTQLSPHARGQRVLAIADQAPPPVGPTIRRLALYVGFDSQRYARPVLPRPRLSLVAR